jgi:hypothetical protein
MRSPLYSPSFRPLFGRAVLLGLFAFGPKQAVSLDPTHDPKPVPKKHPHSISCPDGTCLPPISVWSRVGKLLSGKTCDLVKYM